MRDDLLLYYERELTFIRKLAWDFAEKYPAVAGRLLLEPTKCEDPHVERLIEAFAMLTARVHLRLDDEFPELTDALLGILYPHYVSPIPSATVVQMAADPDQAKVREGITVDRHEVLRSRPVSDVRCGFRTCYPVRMWPIEVASVELVPANTVAASLPPEIRSALVIRVKTSDGEPLSDYAVDALRFFLDADSGTLRVLYELLFKDVAGLLVSKGDRRVRLGAEHVRAVGFERDEGLLEYPTESFVGYRLLQEYFSFSDKFLFAEVSGLERVVSEPGGSDTLEIAVLLTRAHTSVDVRFSPDNLRLGCTPAVNLFPQQADPIRLTQQSVEYRVTPDVRALGCFEVHSIRSVSSTSAGTSRSTTYEPFYALRHGSAQAEDVAFYHAARRPSIRKGDEGSDLYLTLVDKRFQPLQPADEVLHVRALVTNRDLPSRLPFGDPLGDFHLEGRPELTRISCIRKPTPTVRAAMGDQSRWRLVSHLALNHLSLGGHENSSTAPGGDDPALDSLREILKLYDYEDSAVTRQRVEGLVGLRTKKVLRRLGAGSAGFARGIDVELELEEAKYAGAGALLFASVLERFLGLYASVNSFTQTTARLSRREGVMKKWPPRAGEIRLL